MKTMLVVITIAGGMITLIILIDFIMGTDPSTLLWKALNPFRVMESAEYIIIFLFALMFGLRLLQTFLKKRRQRNSEAN